VDVDVDVAKLSSGQQFCHIHNHIHMKTTSAVAGDEGEPPLAYGFFEYAVR
jgi:hypothetical protein